MAAMATLSSFPSSSRFKETSFSFNISSELDSEVLGKGFVRFRRKGIDSRKMVKRVFCNLKDGGDRPSNSSNNEPPESLFMKELRRRGISPTSVLEERKRDTIEEEIMEDGGDNLSSKRNAVATGSDKSLTNQREESMALNSEGLEGLIPRAKLLLTLGGTFFLAFWPLILVTIGSFTALYLMRQLGKVHDATLELAILLIADFCGIWIVLDGSSFSGQMPGLYDSYVHKLLCHTMDYIDDAILIL